MNDNESEKSEKDWGCIIPFAIYAVFVVVVNAMDAVNDGVVVFSFVTIGAIFFMGYIWKNWIS